MQGDAAFFAVEHLVADTDVGKGAAHHHFMVAAARAVGVEVARLDALFAQVATGRAVGLDVAGRGDVVGGHRIAEQRQDAGTRDIGDRRWRLIDGLEERRVLDVGGVVLPGVGVGFRHLYGLPLLVAFEYLGVFLAEHGGVDFLYGLGNFLLGRPDVAQVHRFAVAVFAQRLLGDIHAHAAGQGIGDHQGRRGQPVGFHQRMHAAFEVAVAGQHRGDGQVMFLNGLLDWVRQRAGVADAGGAAVADQVETQLVEVFGQPGGGEVFGHHLGAGGQRALDPRLALEAFLHGLLGQQAGGHHHAGVGGIGAGGDRRDHHGAVAQRVALAVHLVVDLVLRGVADGHATAAFAFQATFLFTRRLELQAEEVFEGLADLGQGDAILRAFRAGQAGFDLAHVQFQGVGEYRLAAGLAPHALGL